VSGNFEAREYQDQQGQTRTSLDVNADEVLMMGNRGDSEGGFGGPVGSSRPENFGSDDSSMDDVPF